MYIQVSYYKPEIQGYDTRAYTYETELDLIPGDIVSAPTAKKPEGNKAMVIEVDVPQPNFPCKKITGMWVEAEEGAAE